MKAAASPDSTGHPGGARARARSRARPPAPDRDAFLDQVRHSLSAGSFIRLVLGSPTPAAAPLQRVTGRCVVIRGEPAFSLTLREPTRDLTRNLPPEAVADWLWSELGTRFQSARLETTERDWQLSLPSHGRTRLIPHPPRSREAPVRTHDQPKHRVLQESAGDWLAALGLLDESGRPFPRRADKYQQVLRYAEILDQSIHELGWPPGTPLRVADMGCGRGYLTFAAWQILHRQRGFPARVTGIEVRPTLAGEAQAVARRLGLEGLQFQTGDLASLPLAPLDILVALHACNTATDHAILRGVRLGARLILVAPCCHQEIRPQLGAPEPLAALLRHGLLAERLAEWLTDGLRALFLEWAGYRTRMLEFVASEHTAKNLLLTGTRGDSPFARRDLRDAIVAAKAHFGIRHHALDPLLDR